MGRILIKFLMFLIGFYNTAIAVRLKNLHDDLAGQPVQAASAFEDAENSLADLGGVLGVRPLRFQILSFRHTFLRRNRLGSRQLPYEVVLDPPLELIFNLERQDLRTCHVLGNELKQSCFE